MQGIEIFQLKWRQNYLYQTESVLIHLKYVGFEIVMFAGLTANFMLKNNYNLLITLNFHFIDIN